MGINDITELPKAMIATVVLAALTLASSPSAAADKEWLRYGGNQWNERHATLTKISKRNVAQLVPRRVLQLARGITLGL
jgi:glucose dehydrogenase